MGSFLKCVPPTSKKRKKKTVVQAKQGIKRAEACTADALPRGAKKKDAVHRNEKIPNPNAKSVRYECMLRLPSLYPALPNVNLWVKVQFQKRPFSSACWAHRDDRNASASAAPALLSALRLISRLVWAAILVVAACMARTILALFFALSLSLASNSPKPKPRGWRLMPMSHLRLTSTRLRCYMLYILKHCTDGRL
jgi:hypothetical protein